MTTIKIGAATVTRVEEMFDDASFKVESFLPSHDPAALAGHMSWLRHGHINEATGSLVLSIHSWLVRTDRHTILIDTCIGNHKHREPVMPQWHQLNGPYLANLAAAGVAPEEVDFVMCSHMHLDHVGWNTRLVDGRWVPTFPNAKYLFSRIENALWADHKSRFARTVYDDSVLPVIDSGQALMVEDGHQLDDLFTVELAPGHTPGHVAFKLASAGSQAHFTGDAIHSPIQIYYPDWSSSACLDPVQSAVTRRRLLEGAAETGAVLLPAHFNAPHGGTIHEADGAFAIDWL